MFLLWDSLIIIFGGDNETSEKKILQDYRLMLDRYF